MDQGIKHLVTCRCILPQFQESVDPPFHQFVAFSVVDGNDQVSVKYAQCPACGIIHKVVDICKSEIMAGRENLSSIMTVEDIKMGLPEKLTATLEKHDVDYATWEQVKWIFDNEKWGQHVVLSSDIVEGLKQVKYLRILGQGLFQMNSHTGDVYI